VTPDLPDGSQPLMPLPPSVSCPSARNCTAVGDYFDRSGNLQGVLLSAAPVGSIAISRASGTPSAPALRPRFAVVVSHIGPRRSANASLACLRLPRSLGAGLDRFRSGPRTFMTGSVIPGFSGEPSVGPGTACS
jgi:hypothetical protein